MASAYTGLLRDLKDLLRHSELIPAIVDGYSSNFQKPSESIIRSWENSVVQVIKILEDDIV